MRNSLCVDFDDYCTSTVHALDTLLKYKEQHSTLKVTLFTIPQRVTDDAIQKARDLGDWVQLAPHGWRHTRGECLGWTSEEAVEKILKAKDRGIDAPVFRAPAWLLDEEVYEACAELGYTVASHWLFRIPDTDVPEYIYNMPKLKVYPIHGHMTNTIAVDNNIESELIKTMFSEIPADASFHFPQDVGEVVHAHIDS